MAESKIKKEVSEKEILDIIELASAPKTDGVVKRGINEVTKAIERGTAQLVVIAKDVEPKAVIAHIPDLCKNKEPKTLLVQVSSKEKLGQAAGIKVPCSAIAVINFGDEAKKVFNKIKSNID